MLTDRRAERMRHVANLRTNYVTVLLDDVHDPHNVAAVLRSADAFGVRDVHAVEQHQRIRVSRRVARGTDCWVNLFRYPSAEIALDVLRSQGFAVWVAAGEAGSGTLAEWTGVSPTVFVFGNEHAGVRPEIRMRADRLFAIPMAGMVESLNISVACAVTLQHARQQLETRRLVDHKEYCLTPDEQTELLRHWQDPALERLAS